jgi:pimeloyl-ACP methyl ester carboxylesterase
MIARTAVLTLALLASPALADAPSVAHLPALQTTFDPIGPAVVALPGAKDRVLHYTDTGEAGWRPVVYLGGTGTSARAMLMTGYLETMRRQLHIRLISVERNGFGDTAFDPAWTLADYAGDVRTVLDHLGVTRFSVVAISGGGPYAAHVAAALGPRVISLHFAAALADRAVGDSINCDLKPAQVAKALGPTIDNPQIWWGFPDTSPTHAIPGFSDRAYDEGARAFFIRGQMGDAAPEAAEMQRYCHANLADLAPALAKVTAPVFTYYGLADHTVAPANALFWQTRLSGPVTPREYPGEGHDVQYRHWDQILIDLSGLAGTGPTARTLVCERGRAKLLPPERADHSRATGSVSGLCLWQP